MPALPTIAAAAGRARSVLVVGCAGVLLGACSQMGSLPMPFGEAQPPASVANFMEPAPKANSRSDLLKATEYWGKEFSKNPRDVKSGLSYARNLKALGEKRQALAVLQQVSIFHAANREVNAEYGRLALEFDQVSVAQKVLEYADDPANPDWHVISARGTVLAKQGKYRDAITFYERALALAPGQASVLNNLALAHAMDGNPDKAEPLLKRAAAAGGHEARVAQNLALVLGLQGKYDEAKVASAKQLPADSAAENVDYVRSIVKLDPKTTPAETAAAPMPAFKSTTTVVTGDAETASPWAAKVAKR